MLTVLQVAIRRRPNGVASVALCSTGGVEMATYDVTARTELAAPQIRKITIGDLFDALRMGWRDFWRHPSHLAFLFVIYPIAGVLIAFWTVGNSAMHLLYPLATGFALIGPFAALPLYEMSRRQELGLDASWTDCLRVWRSPAAGSIALLGLMMLVILAGWLGAAQALHEQLFGFRAISTLSEFTADILGSAQGWTLIFWGNVIGLAFAALTLAVIVVAFPLLVDRPVGATMAVVTSLRAVRANMVPIAVWGLIVAALLMAGSLPLFVGLAVVLPVLGHATWHLYRKLVV
jgi:uncharacterized membrane protein